MVYSVEKKDFVFAKESGIAHCFAILEQILSPLCSSYREVDAKADEEA